MTVKWFIDSYLLAELDPFKKKKKIMRQLNGEWIMAVGFEVPLMRVNYCDFRLRDPRISLPSARANQNSNANLNV